MSTVRVIVFDPALCKGHLACERACSKVHFRDETGGERSAIRILKGKDGYAGSVCNQCGLCIDMCPVMALRRMSNGTVVLNTKACIGCQSCVAFCPDGVMRKADGRMEPFKCISCGKCVEACPEGALSLVDMEIADVAREVYSRHGGVCK